MAEKKITENTEQKEKVMTKYDLKMQKKKEKEEQQKKEDRKSMIMSIIVVLVLAAVVASFPIRTYLATHETYVTIAGEDINRVEFDLNYNLAKTNYENQWGSYMSMFGYDGTVDPATQMYSETLTWKDFFEQQAVEQMKQNVAMMQEAKAAGFEYDTTEEYVKLEEDLNKAAAASGVSEKDFIKAQYGSYATLDRISEYLKETMYLNAYYEKVVKEKTPSMEKIQELYAADPALYDSVDYRMTMVMANFETEATEDQIAKAMDEAKAEAEAADASTGELMEGGRWTALSATVREWLFDDARKTGDTTVIEDASNYCYYAIQFEDRYLNEEPTVDARILISGIVDGEAVLEEWKNAGATEEAFAELCDKHSEDTMVEGGLYEALMNTSMDETLSAWLFDDSRAEGDTVSLKAADGYTYVMYYIGTNDPEWVLDAKQSELSTIMSDYLTEIKSDITVEDPNGKLNYFKVEAAQAELTAAESTATESTAAEATE